MEGEGEGEGEGKGGGGGGGSIEKVYFVTSQIFGCG